MLPGIRVRSLAVMAAGIAIFMQPMTGQKPGNPPGAPGGNAPGGNAPGGNLPGGNVPGGNVPGGTPGTRSIPGQQPGANTRPSPDFMNRGLFLSGKVVMEDGTPPPEPVTIERICNTTPRAQAYTDSKGRFSFQMGQTAGVMQDASEGGSAFPGAPSSQDGLARGMGTRQPGNPAFRLAGCELRASLPGFRSDTVNLTGRRLLDNPDVGTIVLHRLANVEGTVISVTSLQAPDKARKAYDKGRQALQKSKPPEAEKNFQKAVEIYPKYAAAWYELGRLQQRNKDIDSARKSYANALAADARFMSPYLELAQLAAGEQNWRELADTTDKVLKLDPVDYPAAYFYNAVAHLNAGEFDAAEKSARAGEKLDAAHQYPRLEQVLAMVLARRKDYAGALEHMRSYLQFAPATEDKERINKQIAELERLSGANQQADTEPARKDAPRRPQP